ncbi:hypothetical protein [Sphingomonas bacterium]|uniref:hypothetical protein n=1 Tax=Sphingomonas bacterium TaxID=1895847 RepID=UPI00157706AE|nr:hypothetical protein [Sphingomonas bacterium]
MKYSIKRNARSGRFVSARITTAGQVETSEAKDGYPYVAEQTVRRAKRAANTSLKVAEAK